MVSIVEHINLNICVAHFDSTIWKLKQLKLVCHDYILFRTVGLAGQIDGAFVFA